MVAMMLGSRSIPGPALRRLAGYRTLLRSFDRDPLAYIDSAFQKYGPVSALVGESTRLVFALGAACNFELRTNTEAFCSVYPAPGGSVPVGVTVRKITGAAHVAAVGEPITTSWQQLHADPGFDSWYGSTVVEMTQRMVERWGMGQQVDLVYITRRLTLSTLLKTMLGIEPDTSSETHLLLHNWLEHTYRGQPTRLPRPARFADRRTHRIIAQVEALHRALPEHGPADIPVGLRALLSDCEGRESTSVSAEQLVPLVDAAATLITSVLSWTIFLLSQHQRVLDDVQQELRHVLHGEPPTEALLLVAQHQLPVLDRVIKETLRLLAPCALGVRVASKRVELLGYELPAGATLVYSPFLTHRLANLFIAPQRFRPERWLYIEPSSEDYLPLGLPGESILPISLLVKHVKLVLATLLQQAQLGLAAGVQVNVLLQPILLPKNDLPMIVTPMSRSLIQREVHGNILKLVSFNTSGS